MYATSEITDAAGARKEKDKISRPTALVVSRVLYGTHCAIDHA